MPHVINGVGTWHYGKRNWREYPGVCEHCGHDGVLSSYETTKFFVFAMIPLLPLGKRKLRDYCDKCRHYQDMSLADWNSSRENAIRSAGDACEAAPHDPEAAVRLLFTLAAYEQFDLYDATAQDLAARFQNNAAVQSAIGEGYAELCRFNDAEAAFRRSLALSDEREMREQLGILLIRQGRPEEAEPYLRHIVAEAIDEKAAHLISLAQGFQSRGDHRQALEAFDRAAEIAPGIASDKTFKKMRRASEKRLSSSSPLKIEALRALKPPRAGGADFGTRVARIAPIALLLLIALGYLGTSWAMGRGRTVYLVGGLPFAYTASINGADYTVSPGTHRKIRIPEGEFSVTPGEDALGEVEPFTHELRTPFLRRPFDGQTYVLNPDGLAPLYWEKVFYASEPRDAPDSELRFAAGDRFYAFERISFPFREFPEEIESASSKPEARTRIGALDPNVDLDMNLLVSVVEFAGVEVATAMAAAFIRHRPESGRVDDALSFLSVSLGPEEYEEALRPLLDARPLNLYAHRAYQDYVVANDLDLDLESEYRSLLAEEPADPARVYLASKVIYEPNERLALMENAVAEGRADAWIHHRLGEELLSAGEYDRAIDHLRQAEGAEDETVRLPLLLEALYNAGRHDAVMTEAEAWMEHDPDYWALKYEMLVDYAAGGTEAAAKRMETGMPRLREVYHPDTIEVIDADLRAMLVYLSGDYAACAVEYGRTDDPGSQFLAALMSGDLEEASACAGADTVGIYYLQLALAHAARGEHDAAGEMIDRSLWVMSAQSPAHARMVVEIGSSPPVDLERLRYFTLDRLHKALLCKWIAYAEPERRDEALALSERLYPAPDFPRHLIEMPIPDRPLDVAAGG